MFVEGNFKIRGKQNRYFPWEQCVLLYSINKINHSYSNKTNLLQEWEWRYKRTAVLVACWVFLESFPTRSSPISSWSVRWVKRFFGDFIFVFEWKQSSKLQKRSFSSHGHQFSRSLTHNSTTAMFTGWSTIFEMLSSRVTFVLNSSTWPRFSQWERLWVKNALAI